MIKKFSLTIIFILIVSNVGIPQYRNIDKPLNRSTNNLILGIFNPKNFSMKHSFEVSMMTSSYGNISLTSYVNSMNYKFSEKLNLSADVRLQYSPYASSPLGNGVANNLQKELSGLSLSRLSLDYKISDNSYLKFEYRNLNDGLLYNRYNNPFMYNDNFLR